MKNFQLWALEVLVDYLLNFSQTSCIPVLPVRLTILTHLDSVLYHSCPLTIYYFAVYSRFDHDIIIWSLAWSSSIHVELKSLNCRGICHGSSDLRPTQSTQQRLKLSVAFFCLPGPDRNPLWHHSNTDRQPGGAGPQLQSAGWVSFFLITKSKQLHSQ